MLNVESDSVPQTWPRTELSHVPWQSPIVVDYTTYSVLLTSSTTMRCPKCGSRDDKVIDSRQSRDNSSIRRRRECLTCEYRFTTYEQVERSDLRVVKRDRTHESFDRSKLVKSLARACEKRPISLVTLEHAVDEIVHELETSGREVQSSAIGAKVLEKLRGIDEVAYLRYASVHQRFEDVDQFVHAAQALGRRVKPNSQQRELFPPEPVVHGRV
jgi:transcriptional repressor NrdR